MFRGWTGLDVTNLISASDRGRVTGGEGSFRGTGMLVDGVEAVCWFRLFLAFPNHD